MKQRKAFTLIEILTVIAIFALLSGIILANLQRGKQTQVLREASQKFVDDIRQMQNQTSVGTSLNVCKRDKGVTNQNEYLESCTTIGETCSTTGFTCSRVFPPGGYGIFFDHKKTGQYTLYADFGSVDKRNDTFGTPVLYEGIGGTDSDIYTETLPKDVVIASAWITPQFNQDAGFVYTQNGAEAGIDTCYKKTDGDINPLSASINSDLSIAWMPPSVKMYAIITNDGSHGACPDYLITILLKHTKANTCRKILINGASGLVDEKADSSCTI